MLLGCFHRLADEPLTLIKPSVFLSFFYEFADLTGLKI